MSRQDPRSCSICGAEAGASFFSVQSVPVHVCVLWPDAASARDCPKGDIELSFCASCGFIENQAFDARLVEYTPNYENSLNFSEFFQGYIKDFAQQVIERHKLTDKLVVEIGSGDGEFLELLCTLAPNRGIGFDPSYDEGAPMTRADGRVTFRREYYSPDTVHERPDFVACRQVLEHIPAPVAFLTDIRKTLADKLDAGLVFEVPNAMYTFEQTSLWDIIYEHCTYFSQGTLASLFARCGFDVQDSLETYARQFIAIDAKPSSADVGQVAEHLDDLQQLATEVQRFAAAYEERIRSWQGELAARMGCGERVVVWSAGARGVNFLNIADPDHTIQHVVDINPKKHGLYVSGSGQQVVEPEFLKQYDPDLVIVMNPNYLDEIKSSLHDLGLDPEVKRA